MIQTWQIFIYYDSRI